jgi:hypothetical protein
MNELDLQTEIFDLIGEVGSCSICQDDFKDGERARAITKCQHHFHISCIDKWLAKKGSCPLCRTPIINISKIQEIYTNIMNLSSELPVERHVVCNVILKYIKGILDLSKPLVNTISELNRYILTFCIVDGILNKFTTSTSFNKNKNLIPKILINIELNNVKPLLFECSTLLALKKYRNELSYKIKKITFWIGSINQQRQVKTLKKELKNQFKTVLDPIWS